MLFIQPFLCRPRRRSSVKDGDDEACDMSEPCEDDNEKTAVALESIRVWRRWLFISTLAISATGLTFRIPIQAREPHENSQRIKCAAVSLLAETEHYYI